MRRCSLLVLLAAAVAALPAAAVPDGGDALEHNRELLEKWRADPDHYARLQRDLRAFWALPPARRKQMRQLDQDLHQEGAKERKRLWAVLERYHIWLGGLPEADRGRVEAAAGPDERLRVIREIRERQWEERLPAKVRGELLKLPPERRPAQIALLRKEEQRHRRQWRRGLRVNPPPRFRPTHLKEFPAEFQAFVENVLTPRLSPREKEQLKQAESKWPQYARTLDRLSREYPELPPLRGGKIVNYQQLPADVKRGLTLSEAQKHPELWQLRGRWPDFAQKLVEIWKLNKRVRLPPLGASDPEELGTSVEVFLAGKLTPALSLAEVQALKKLEKRWPDYPLKLLELARKHRLSVPGMSLPWPNELWDSLPVER
jgi:hypothetical protein